MVETANKEQSKFNEANLNILRLHHSWLKCSAFRQKGMYEAWRCELDNVWSELCADVSRMTDEKDIEEENKNLREATAKVKNSIELYNAISARQVFLRRLQDKCGKGGSYVDSTELDFE